MNNELQKQITSSSDLSIFSDGGFRMMANTASMMARSSLVPETLRTTGSGNNKRDLPLEVVEANCFRIVEQSHRWGYSPFSVLDHVSIIHGKLMYEGKLVHAVLETQTGVNLSASYKGSGDDMEVTISGTLPGESNPRVIKGTVRQWKTTGSNSPWSNPLNYVKQLAYRGYREWCRVHKPSVMLGVYTDDEALPVLDEKGMRNVNPPKEKIEPFKQEALIEDEKKDQTIEEHAPISPPSDEDGYRRAFVSSVASDGAPEKLDDEGVVISRAWNRYRVTISYGDSSEVATTFSTRLGKFAKSAEAAWVMAKVIDTDKGRKLDDIKADVAATSLEGGIA